MQSFIPGLIVALFPSQLLRNRKKSDLYFTGNFDSTMSATFLYKPFKLDRVEGLALSKLVLLKQNVL